jgi:hypothetical protein
MINTGKTQVNSAPLSINFPLKCRTVQVKNPLQCRAPSTLANLYYSKQLNIYATQVATNVKLQG